MTEQGEKSSKPDLKAFEKLRIAELKDTEALIRRYGGPNCRVLEIGAGIGWQAKTLSGLGYRVQAIDLPVENEISNHARNRIWPIIDYDGKNIPFNNNSFDIVYSSNVLEHVLNPDALNQEIHRVLRPGGFAIHLVPNSVWRLSSLLSYYPAQAIDLIRVMRRLFFSQTMRNNRHSAPTAQPQASPRKYGSYASKLARRIIPSKHGAYGTALSELLRFSRRNWDRFFTHQGWNIIEYRHNGIWATGDYLMGDLLPIQLRRHIGQLIGGIAHVYVLQSKSEALHQNRKPGPRS